MLSEVNPILIGPYPCVNIGKLIFLKKLTCLEYYTSDTFVICQTVPGIKGIYKLKLFTSRNTEAKCDEKIC